MLGRFPHLVFQKNAMARKIRKAAVFAVRQVKIDDFPFAHKSLLLKV
jgi:hypothetical protein